MENEKHMLEVIWNSIVSFFADVGDTLDASVVQEESVEKPLPNAQKHLGVQRKVSYIGRIREAEKLISHGYYSEAGLELSLAVQERKGVIKPFVLLGDIYVRLGDRQKLDALIGQLQKKFSGSPEIAVLQVRRALLDSNFQRAKQIIAQTQTPTPRLLVYQAALLALQNNHTKAQKILEIVAELPEEPYRLSVGSDGVHEENIHKTLTPELKSVVQGLLNRYEEFSLLSEGKNAHLFVLLGKELASLDESQLVRGFADVAVTDDTGYIDAWTLRGYSYFLEHNFDSALKDFHQAYRLDPVRPQTHYFMALILSELGRTKEAIAFFEKALESDFEFSQELEWRLATLLAKEEHFDQAVELYRHLVTNQTDPEQVSSVFYTLIQKAKRADVAIEIAERLIISNAQNPFYLNMYGWALFSNEEFSKAEEILETALDIQPENPQTLLNLGVLAELKGDYKEAKEWYKKSHTLGKGQPDFAAIVNLAADRYNKIKDRR